MKERRSKVFWVDERTIFFLFVEFTKSPAEFVSIPTPINLPEGAEIDRVHYDQMRRGFAFVVSHPSFPIWEDGCECPRGDAVLAFGATRRMCKAERQPGDHTFFVNRLPDGGTYARSFGIDPGHPEGDRIGSITITYPKLTKQWSRGDLAMLLGDKGSDVMVAITDDREDTAGLLGIMIVETRCECGARPDQLRAMTADELSACHAAIGVRITESPKTGFFFAKPGMMDWTKGAS